MVQGVNKNVIVTNDGRQYQKPSKARNVASFYAGSAAQAAAAIPLIPLSGKIMAGMREINNSVDTAEITKAIKQAMEISGMKEKGVRLYNSSPKIILTPGGIKRNFIEFISKLLSRPANPKKPFKPLNAYNNYVIRQIRHGYNACFNPKNNGVYINIDKMGTSAFHEIGHAINRNSSKFWRGMQKLRKPMMLAAMAFPMIALFKRKKAEGEEPKSIIDKTTTFIKNNVGKLTTLAFVPVVAEELMASARGNALAKKVLSPELVSKVVKSNRLGAIAYIATGIACGVGAYLGNKVRDAIAKPKEIKQ